MEHHYFRTYTKDEKEQETISKLKSAIQANSLDLSCKAITDLWNLSAEKCSDLKSIPKLFASKSFKPIFRSIMTNVIALERLGMGLANNTIAVSSGDNILISGVRGVGKTTLMTSLARVLSIACQNVLPVYWDYENMDCKLPAQIILDQLQQRRTDVYEAFKGTTDCTNLLRQLQSKGIYVAFFADEVQNLYKPDRAHDSLEVQCVQQLLSVGKEPNCFGVISSSLGDFPSLAYKRLTKNSHQFHDYPNLNNTVYVFHRLLPIREQEELHNYLLVRYPDVDVQTETVFMKTGGLARSIDQLITGNDVQTNISTALQLQAFKAVAHRLFLNKQHLVQGTSTPWKQTALHHSEVLGAMRPYTTEDDRERLLNEWIDSGLLYANNCHYELLVPNDYQVIKDYFENNPSIDN